MPNPNMHHLLHNKVEKKKKLNTMAVLWLTLATLCKVRRVHRRGGGKWKITKNILTWAEVSLCNAITMGWRKKTVEDWTDDFCGMKLSKKARGCAVPSSEALVCRYCLLQPSLDPPKSCTTGSESTLSQEDRKEMKEQTVSQEV